MSLEYEGFELPRVDDIVTLPSGESKRFGDCTKEDVGSMIDALKANRSHKQKVLIPDTLMMRHEILFSIFEEISSLGDVSMQMNTDRGGLFIQVSKLDWPDGIEEIIADSIYEPYLVIDHNPYAMIIHCVGDTIK